MSTNATALTTDPAAGAGGGAPQDWRASLPEEMRSEKSLETFKDIPSLAKSYIETKKMMGGAVAMPKADAKPEDWDAFYTRLGRPESPDKYELKRPESPAGGKWDENLEKEFKIVSHASGLQPRQAQSLLDWFNKTQSEHVANYTKSMEEGVGKLKTEWGAKFDERVSVASRAVKELGGDELKTMLEETGLGNNPILIKVFAKIGESMAESTFVTGDTGHVDNSSKDALKIKADAILAEIHANPRMAPAAREAKLREKDAIYKQLYPESE